MSPKPNSCLSLLILDRLSSKNIRFLSVSPAGSGTRGNQPPRERAGPAYSFLKVTGYFLIVTGIFFDIIGTMAKDIHPQALVDPRAQIADGVSVGPYAVIGSGVRILNGTRIDAFAQVIGNTEVGRDCKIFSYSVVGSPPQDLKYKGEKTFLTIGDRNTIREFVTINPGTEEGSKTVIGNDNLIMAYSHIAHNCMVGSYNVLANVATLAGHVEVGDRAVIGGLVAIHQFCRIGNFAMIGGCSKVVQDVPPYSLCDGHPARVRGINLVGLRRRKMPKEVVEALKKAFKLFFFEDHSFDVARQLVQNSLPVSPELDEVINFVSSSKRGICR